MGYSKSSSYKGFISETDVIIANLKKIKNSHRNIDAFLKNYVIASAIFLSHAEIENYIEDFFERYSRILLGKFLYELTDDLKAHFILQFMKKDNLNHIINKNEKSILDSIKKECKQGSVKSLFDHTAQLQYITGKDLYTTNKYPSKRNFEILYNRIGIKNLFSILDRKMHQNSANICEQLGEYRTSLAHSASLVGVTVDDVLLALNKTRKFINALDRVSYQNIVSNYGQRIWEDSFRT